MGSETIFWYSSSFGIVFFLFVIGSIVSGLGANGLRFDCEENQCHNRHKANKLFSLHSISAFFIGFGFGGLIALKQFEYGSGEAAGFAMVVGIAGLLICTYLFNMVFFSSGGRPSGEIDECLNKGAEVCKTIPAGGTGRIRLSVCGNVREVSAQSESDKPFHVGTKVRITKILDPETVSVSASIS